METTSLQTFLGELVPAVGAWSARNFGEQGAYRPLLGIIEELTELGEALERKDRAKVLDAVGDTVIYMADYYHRSSLVPGEPGAEQDGVWDLGRTWVRATQEDVECSLLALIGGLAHCHLKAEQKIRGMSSASVRRWCGCTLLHLEDVCDLLGENLSAVIQGTWSQVSKRDWKRNPTNAHAVAEQASSDIGDVLG